MEPTPPVEVLASPAPAVDNADAAVTRSGHGPPPNVSPTAAVDNVDAAVTRSGHGPPSKRASDSVVLSADDARRSQSPDVLNLGVISLFDGVGSVLPTVIRQYGGTPRVFVAAEQDAVLRQLVCDQFGLAEDERWVQLSTGTQALYLRDVRTLFRQGARKLSEAVALAPDALWLVVAGSPCQDLTLAGELKGLLGLTGPTSSLFYYVHLAIWLLQIRLGPVRVRFLVENAGVHAEGTP